MEHNFVTKVEYFLPPSHLWSVLYATYGKQPECEVAHYIYTRKLFISMNKCTSGMG